MEFAKLFFGVMLVIVIVFLVIRMNSKVKKSQINKKEPNVTIKPLPVELTPPTSHRENRDKNVRRSTRTETHQNSDQINNLTNQMVMGHIIMDTLDDPKEEKYEDENRYENKKYETKDTYSHRNDDDNYSRSTNDHYSHSNNESYSNNNTSSSDSGGYSGD